MVTNRDWNFGLDSASG